MEDEMNREFHSDEEVFLDTERSTVRYRTHIIGRKADHYIVVDLSADHRIKSQMEVNDLIWVYCYESPVCRFKTRVRQIFEDPPLLVLDYPLPRAIEAMEHRRDERSMVFVPVELYPDSTHHKKLPWTGYILDISSSGCQILGDLTAYVDRNVCLSFRIPWTGANIQARARVVRCEATEKEIRSGLKFIDLDPNNQDQLSALIGSLKDGRLNITMVEDENSATGRLDAAS
jgi:c-di-GMP-binding flagellar brake protein YcgR